MNTNYLVFPMEFLNITQGYDGKVSHSRHLGSKCSDYCYDLAGKDPGRDPFFCPCDSMKVMHIYGVNNSQKTNTLWLQSTEKVLFADGSEDFVTMQCTHMNDDDLKKLKTGQIFKRGEKMFREGSDGASGNHIHLSVRKGKFITPGWKKNEKGAWCCISTGEKVRIEDAFFLSGQKIKKTGGYVFSKKPDLYRVRAVLLNVRTGPGTDFDKATVNSKAYRLKKGTVVKVTQSEETQKRLWGKIGKGQWICLDYCEAVKQ